MLASKELTKFNLNKSFNWNTSQEKGNVKASDIMGAPKLNTLVEKKPSKSNIIDIERSYKLGNKIIDGCAYNQTGQIINFTKDINKYKKVEEGKEAEKSAVLNMMGSELGKQNKKIVSIFNISDTERVEFNKLDKNIPTYAELEDFTGKENINPFIAKMHARREIFSSTSRMVETFMSAYRTSWKSTHVKEQNQAVDRFITAYKTHKESLQD